MAAPLTNEERFIKYFNPKEYYDACYATGKGFLLGEWIPFVLKNLHEFFSSGEVKGDTLIDLGTGPSIYPLLSACETFKNIIVSDILEQNLVYIRKWLRKDPDMLDWSEIVQVVCDLEGNGEKCEEKEDKLRRAARDVLKCDVLKKNPFEPLVLPLADCVMSCLCLEAACKDVDSYCYTVKNLKNLLKPGGHIVLMGAMNATHFCVREQRFSALSVTKEDVAEAFTDGGYEILKLELKLREDMSFKNSSDYKGFYFVAARKPSNL